MTKTKKALKRSAVSLCNLSPARKTHRWQTHHLHRFSWPPQRKEGRRTVTQRENVSAQYGKQSSHQRQACDLFHQRVCCSSVCPLTNLIWKVTDSINFVSAMFSSCLIITGILRYIKIFFTSECKKYEILCHTGFLDFRLSHFYLDLRNFENWWCKPTRTTCCSSSNDH